MNTLVKTNTQGKNVTTSLIIAEIFEKEHKNVIRDIENLTCSEEFNKLNFEPISYTDTRGRTQRAYELTKDGFSFLVMGYTGEKASQFKERFIKEFNNREQLLNSEEYILARSQEILQKRITLAEQKIQQLTNQIQQDQTKVTFANAIIGSNNSCLIGELAKIITQNGVKIGQNRLFADLRQKGYLGTKGENYNLPNQRYIEQGLFTLKKGVRNGNDGVLYTTITPKITPKGQQYFINKYLTQHTQTL